jgi:hypothetical protein
VSRTQARFTQGRELKWQEVALEQPLLDFNAILGRESTQSVAYAVCYLRSEAPQPGLEMLVGGDREAKLYLNGKEVYRAHATRHHAGFPHHAPNVALNAGLNALVLKVIPGTFDWKASICLTDTQGNPVKGVQVTLDPDAKEKADLKKP